MNIIHSFSDMITDFFSGFKKQSFTKAHFMVIGSFFGIALFFAIVYGIFGACVSCRERAALKSFSEAAQLYDRAKRDSDAATDWATIAKMFQNNHAAHDRSYIAPYFLLFQADSLVRAHDTEKAQEVIRQAAEEAEKQPLYALIKLKEYLMALDSEDQELQEQTIEKMRAFAADISNIYSDAALYHLGRYFLIKNRLEDARATFIDLFDRYESDQVSPSPWLSKAYALLQQID